MEIENGPRYAMFGAKPLSAPILTYNQDQTSGLLNVKKNFSFKKRNSKISSAKLAAIWHGLNVLNVGYKTELGLHSIFS